MSRKDYKESRTLEFLANRSIDFFILTFTSLSAILGIGLYNTNKSLNKIEPQLRNTTKAMQYGIEEITPTKKNNLEYQILANYSKNK